MSILKTFSEGSLCKQFEDFLKVKYPNGVLSVEEKLDKFESIFIMGLNQAKKFHRMKKSSRLLFNDKPPRADMVQKLGYILFELQSVTGYPRVPPLQLRSAIKKIIGKDKRYTDKYQDWILSHSNHHQRFNVVDLTNLVNQFPADKIMKMEFF